ncbi:unnamed protein product [Pipistrellus nathusii]|uniref:Interleukin-3 n=1 Tax=Pipistrellus nathusii TaxID=59473 RepID=A0ABP0A6A0_PIPNA
MSGLPVLPLGLLLLALHAPQAPGQPIGTDSSTYSPLINEIQAILNEPPVPSPDRLSSNEKFILRNETFLKLNLDTFLNATHHFADKGDKIRALLKEFKTGLPTPTAMEEDPISIKTGNWGDFRRKLNEYLYALKNRSGRDRFVSVDRASA